MPIEQLFGIFIWAVSKALCEPAIDAGEHRARLLAMSLFREQPREAGRRTQFKRLRFLAARNFDHSAEGLSSRGYRGGGIQARIIYWECMSADQVYGATTQPWRALEYSSCVW